MPTAVGAGCKLGDGGLEEREAACSERRREWQGRGTAALCWSKTNTVLGDCVSGCKQLSRAPAGRLASLQVRTNMQSRQRTMHPPAAFRCVGITSATTLERVTRPAQRAGVVSAAGTPSSSLDSQLLTDSKGWVQAGRHLTLWLNTRCRAAHPGTLCFSRRRRRRYSPAPPPNCTATATAAARLPSPSCSFDAAVVTLRTLVLFIRWPRSSMPGTVPAAASSGQQRPLSQIDRIKSQKALAAANGSGGVAAHGGETYMRGARGQAEDLDRLVKLDWTKVGGCAASPPPLLLCYGGGGRGGGGGKRAGPGQP